MYETNELIIIDKTVLDTSQSFVQKQMRSLESRQTAAVPSFQSTPITDTQVAHARLNKAGHRPLGRTQSAPLPLGHPLLNSTSVPGQQLSVHYEDYELPNQQLSAHNYLKQVYFIYCFLFSCNKSSKSSAYFTQYG